MIKANSSSHSMKLSRGSCWSDALCVDNKICVGSKAVGQVGNKFKLLRLTVLKKNYFSSRSSWPLNVWIVEHSYRTLCTLYPWVLVVFSQASSGICYWQLLEYWTGGIFGLTLYFFSYKSNYLYVSGFKKKKTINI